MVFDLPSARGAGRWARREQAAGGFQHGLAVRGAGLVGPARRAVHAPLVAAAVLGGLAFLSTLTSVNEQSGWLAFSHSANCWAFLRVGLLSVRYRHFVTSDPLVLGYRATVSAPARAAVNSGRGVRRR